LNDFLSNDTAVKKSNDDKSISFYINKISDFNSLFKINKFDSISNDVPLDNLNQLSLGLYLLGEIIITDAFLDFHPTASDWYVPNHICKLSWNRDVLGHNTLIKKIKFFNGWLWQSRSPWGRVI
jgi:hypothetical protein